MVFKLPTPCCTQHIFFQVHSQTVSRGEGISQMQLRYQISRKRLPPGWPNLTRQVHKRDRAFPEKNKKPNQNKTKQKTIQNVRRIPCHRDSLFLSLKVEGPYDKKWDFPLGVETDPWQIRRKGTGTSILRPQGIEFCHKYISLEDSTCWMIMTDTLSLALVRLGAENTVTSLPDFDKQKQWVNKWVLF